MGWEYRSGGYIAAVDSATLDRMAELAVGFGANVQPGQRVHVVASLGQEELTRAVVERAYKAGAVYVHVVYRDPYVQRARLLCKQAKGQPQHRRVIDRAAKLRNEHARPASPP